MIPNPPVAQVKRMRESGCKQLGTLHTIPNITLYALSGELIASGQFSNDLWKQIKLFKDISKKNPHKITFIPHNTVIILEFFDDLICSSYGTEFTVIYQKISIEDYKIMYCKSSCNNYEYYAENPYIPESCDCEYCLYDEKKVKAWHNRDERVYNFYINNYGN
jgi:hypothetical protein